MLLSQKTKISRAVTVTQGAAGATAIEGAVLDMAGFDGVRMIVQMGAIVSGAVTSIKAQQGNQADLSDAEDLAGSAQTIADTDDEKVFYIDLLKPSKRYVRLYVSRATQNATLTALYEQYAPRSTPVSQGSNVSGEAHVTPLAGTA